MSFIASVYEQMSMDRSGHKKPKSVYNYATGKHQKPAVDMSTPEMKKRVGPTDIKVREALRRAGVK